MSDANRPPATQLPSAGKLLRSTALALAVAVVVLVVAVLPAEYGVDPTRIGSVFGLTEMGRVKRQLAMEGEAGEALATGAVTVPVTAAAPIAPAPIASAPPPPVAPVQATAVGRGDTTVITLAPDAAAEVKLVMEKGAKARFSWVSSGGKVNFDTHADGPGVSYHGYEKGSTAQSEGELVAAFTGSHGWFWRNRTGAPVTVTLKTSGAYSEVKRVL